MESRTNIIRIDDESFNILSAREPYECDGFVSFELNRKEFEAFEFLVTSFQKEFKNSYFDPEEWMKEQTTNEKVSAGDRGCLVFSFLLLYGKSKDSINAKQ